MMRERTAALSRLRCESVPLEFSTFGYPSGPRSPAWAGWPRTILSRGVSTLISALSTQSILRLTPPRLPTIDPPPFGSARSWLRRPAHVRPEPGQIIDWRHDPPREHTEQGRGVPQDGPGWPFAPRRYLPRPGSLKGRHSAPWPSSAAAGWQHPGPVNRRAGLHGTCWPLLLAFPLIPLNRARHKELGAPPPTTLQSQSTGPWLSRCAPCARTICATARASPRLIWPGKRHARRPDCGSPPSANVPCRLERGRKTVSSRAWFRTEVCNHRGGEK
jgi:hypothetical protein